MSRRMLDAFLVDLYPGLSLMSLNLDAREMDGTRTTPSDDEAMGSEQLRAMQALVESECRKLAEEVASIPARVQERLSGTIESKVDPPTMDKSVCAKMENEVRNLQIKLQQTQKDVFLRDNRSIDLDKQLLLAQAEIQKLQDNNRALRDIVLNNTSGREVSDEDIVRGFTALRQQIQSLAHNKTLQVEQGNLLLPRHLSPHMAVLSSLWTRSPRKDRLLMTRAALFHILNERVLESNVFGIDELNHTANTGRRKVENGLRIFEASMIECGVPSNMLTDWRLSTLRCIELANMQSKDIGEQLAEDVYAVFEPLIPERTGKSDREKLQGSIRRLCKDAHELRLLMRKSNNGYTCHALFPEDKLDRADHLACPFGMMSGEKSGRSDHVGETIAFTLFSALIKDPRPGGGEEKVLEKAQVIIYRNE